MVEPWLDTGESRKRVPPADLGSTIRWMVLPRGILAVLFGGVALVWPGITVWGMAVAFGVYAITDGLTAVVSAVHWRGGLWVRCPWPGRISPRSRCST